MSSLYRNGISPTRQSYPPPFQPPLLQPLGYILETRATRRREITSLKDLRKEINTTQSRERLFVVHNRDVRVLELLGVEASATAGGGWGRGEIGEWAWEYPDFQESSLSFRNVSLFTRDDGWLLLVDPPRRSRPLPPRLKHQDAATRKSALRSASYHAASHPNSPSLDEHLCKAFGKEDSLPEALGELVFDRWAMFLSSLNHKDTPWRKERPLYQALLVLEQTEDFVRFLNKKSQQLSTPTHQDIAILLTRLHRHIQLLPPPQTSPTTAPTPSASDRALNRISYIGGLLLPVTVVASVLAIEGDYGPEGGNFWVFWVASAVVSLVAVGLIHIDEVRGVEVWREVAEEIGLLGADDDVEVDQGKDRGSVRDGHGLVWERRELGWGGAVKKVSGYYRLRGVKGLKFDRPDGK